MKRIQRKRAKGWKMPENTVYVGRPSRWGNPFRQLQDVVYVIHPETKKEIYFCMASEHTAIELYKECILNNAMIYVYFKDYPALFIAWMYRHFLRIAWHVDELQGKDLACWCPLDKPCHADVLIELAKKLEVK